LYKILKQTNIYLFIQEKKEKLIDLYLNKMKKYINLRIYNKIVGSICPNYKPTIRIKILKVNLYKISILWINRNAL
jgi:hypothetical protein